MATTRRALKPGFITFLKVMAGLIAFAGIMGILMAVGIFRGKAAVASRQVNSQIALPSVQDSDAGAQEFNLGALPSNRPLAPTAPGVQRIRYLGFAWNSQMGLMYANGGPVTTEGSLMAREHVHLSIGRQDDTGIMASRLVACARQLVSGQTDCTAGADAADGPIHFYSVMGDGGAMILKSVNDQLRLLAPNDPNMVAEVIGSAGYSRGEDKFMGPPAWRTNPQSARGGVIAGVVRDGDWNIALDWIRKNNLCYNPDPATYDPNCLNWMSTTTYLEPVEKYNQSACESRPEVRDGRRTGRTHNACVQAVVTWTPGDVNVVQGRGGLVSLLSTRENASQMPNAIIGLRAWNRAHRPAVVGMLTAIGLGGQAIQTSERSLGLAAMISNDVYHEQGTSPDYWQTMYRGATRLDRATGEMVSVGGSRANNLADMMSVFGLNPGTPNIMETTYTVFGNLVHEQYPSELPSFAPFQQVSDTSYVRDAAQHAVAEYGAHGTGEVEQVAFNQTQAAAAPVVGNQNWNIVFATGSSQFDGAATATLRDLLQGLEVSSNTFVEIDGHTDNVGAPEQNRVLSLQRAQAVANWLRAQAPAQFPDGRVRVQGFGQERPAQTNDTPEGRAANRRVQVVLRSNNS